MQGVAATRPSTLSVGDLVRHAALTHGEGLATLCGGRALTWRQLAATVARVAGGLVAVGAEAGVRVALLGHNSDHYLHLVFAVASTGAIVVPLNVRSSAAEIAFVLEDSAAAVLCAEPALARAVLPLPSLVHTLVLLPSEEEPTTSSTDAGVPRPVGVAVLEYARLTEAAPLPWAGGASESVGQAFGIFFTSGTTGGPKGVMLSHANQLTQATNKLSAIPLHRGSVYLCTLPLFHIGGINIGLAAAMAACATVLPRPRPAWADVWQMMDEQRASVLAVVPAMLQLLLDAAEQPAAAAAAEAAAPNVEHVLVGGQSMVAAQRARAHGRFCRAQLVQTYACTEACSSITFLQVPRHQPPPPPPPPDVAAAAAAAASTSASSAAADASASADDDAARWGAVPVGRAVPGARVAILDEQLRPLPHGRVGQIATAGPHVMLGYWRQPTLTSETITTVAAAPQWQAAPPWLLTGDLGVLTPDGTLHFAGRLKDVIKSGGENVPAGLVERALLAHPLVAEAAVFGLPDATYGERVVAAIVTVPTQQQQQPPPPPIEVVWAALPQLMREAGAAQYMRPRQLLLYRSLPRGPSGKVLKRLLQRALVAPDGAAADAALTPLAEVSSLKDGVSRRTVAVELE